MMYMLLCLVLGGVWGAKTSELRSGPTSPHGTFVQVRQKKNPSGWMQPCVLGLGVGSRAQDAFRAQVTGLVGCLCEGSTRPLIHGDPASPSP